jgi:hypothetical protein
LIGSLSFLIRPFSNGVKERYLGWLVS